MITTRRTIAALSGLTLALSGVALTSAQADTFDVSYAPARYATYGQTFITHPTDIAIDPTGADPSTFFVAENNGSASSHLQALKDNPNVANKFSLGDGSILENSTSGLAGPQGLSFDSAHRLWVADPSAATVSVFTPGDSVPYTTIYGSNTGLSAPYDVAVSKSGEVFVAELGANDSIRIFGAGRGGNIRPVRTINTGISEPQSIAIDSAGLIYVANARTGNGTESIDVYPANADLASPPIRTITGSNTHLHGVSSIALDSQDNLYVANPYDGTDGSITVYAPGAQGNAYPIKRLVGDATTQIHQPSGVAVDSDRRVHVVNEYRINPTDNSVFTFAPLVPLTKPSAARSIAVSGSSTSTTRKITWSAPTTTGGTPITKYLVVVKKGSKVTYNKTTTSRSYTVRKSTLSNGTNTVTITAVNKVGNAPAATKTFTVKK